MKKFLLFVLSLMVINNAFAQTCNCSVTIQQEGSYDAKSLGYKPGQTICIQAGNYKYLYFRNLIGTQEQPIKLINCGGLVTVGTEAGQNGIQFYDSKFVKLTGSGDSRFKYGINLNKTPANYSGIVVTGFSSDFEIEQVEVSGTGFAGIMIKYDPSCDPATWRRSFAMYNIRVHDSYIHDTGAEGLYVGSSYWNSGMTVMCGSVSTIVYPHTIYGLKIYNNLTERTGAEGIQYACAPDSRVYNNVVRNAGVAPFANYQTNGIQASGGVSGRLYNNIIQNAPGNGINIIGHSGTNMVYNNLITNVGGAGVFCDNRAGTPANNSIIFANNTIVNTGLDGFRLYNTLDLTTLTNNLVIQAATGRLALTAGVRLTQQTNNYQAWLSTALTKKIIDDKYKPMAGSPLVDKGVFNASWAISTDLQGQFRKMGAGVDIGAYEFSSSTVNALPEEADDTLDLSTARQAFDYSEIQQPGLQLFPSPCTTNLVIKTKDIESSILEVRIYSIKGEQTSLILPLLPVNEIQLQTGNFAVGEYIYQVKILDGSWLSGRFIKQ